MGYTHYYYRNKILPKKEFSRVVADFKKILPNIGGLGISLASWDGTGEPEITEDIIAFNGNANCGHPKKSNLHITWPAKGAGGVGVAQVTGEWFAGTHLATRACGGDCSHESFVLERVFQPESWQKPKHGGKWGAFCKTAFKPYDLAVNAVLIIAKHHLGDRIIVHSDGEEEHWWDAMQLCAYKLGYEEEWHLDP